MWRFPQCSLSPFSFCFGSAVRGPDAALRRLAQFDKGGDGFPGDRRGDEVHLTVDFVLHWGIYTDVVLELASLTPMVRQTSATVTPVSACFSAHTTCCSVKLRSLHGNYVSTYRHNYQASTIPSSVSFFGEVTLWRYANH